MESNAVVENEVDERLAQEYSAEVLALEEQKMSAAGNDLNVKRLLQLMQNVTESWDKQ